MVQDWDYRHRPGRISLFVRDKARRLGSFVCASLVSCQVCGGLDLATRIGHPAGRACECSCCTSIAVAKDLVQTFCRGRDDSRPGRTVKSAVDKRNEVKSGFA